MERLSIVVFLYLLCFSLQVKVFQAQNTLQSTCTEIGAFEIYDGTCKNYYLCIDNGEKLVQVIMRCAETAIFDPTLGRCEKNLTTCEQIPRCSQYGRFPIQDTNCKMYYFCYWNGIGYTMIGNLSCPNSLVFEPRSQKCVSPQKYVCSEAEE